MCYKCQIKLKYIINFVYLILAVMIIELLGTLPIIRDAYTISSGSAFDVGLNYLATTTSVAAGISIGAYLYYNAKQYATKKTEVNTNVKTRSVEIEVKFCSVFNPFC